MNDDQCLNQTQPDFEGGEGRPAPVSCVRTVSIMHPDLFVQLLVRRIHAQIAHDRA